MGEDKGLFRLTSISIESMSFDRLNSTHKWIWCWTGSLYSRCQNGEGERQQGGQLHDCEFAMLGLILLMEEMGLIFEDCENFTIQRALNRYLYAILTWQVAVRVMDHLNTSI